MEWEELVRTARQLEDTITSKLHTKPYDSASTAADLHTLRQCIDAMQGIGGTERIRVLTIERFEDVLKRLGKDSRDLERRSSLDKFSLLFNPTQSNVKIDDNYYMNEKVKIDASTSMTEQVLQMATEAQVRLMEQRRNMQSTMATRISSLTRT